MKGRSGKKDRQESGRTALGLLLHDGFDAFILLRDLTALVEPRNSELP